MDTIFIASYGSLYEVENPYLDLTKSSDYLYSNSWRIIAGMDGSSRSKMYTTLGAWSLEAATFYTETSAIDMRSGLGQDPEVIWPEPPVDSGFFSGGVFPIPEIDEETNAESDVDLADEGIVLTLSPTALNAFFSDLTSEDIPEDSDFFGLVVVPEETYADLIEDGLDVMRNIALADSVEPDDRINAASSLIGAVLALTE